MCVICVDYLKGLLTIEEARRNMYEMDIDVEHRVDIEVMFQDKKK